MNKVDLACLAKEDAFKLIGGDWMLVCAGKKGRFNMMTASWGGIGWLWNRPVAFVFIRPERYTHEFVEAEERLSLSFFTEAWRDALKFCGSKSGRDFVPGFTHHKTHIFPEGLQVELQFGNLTLGRWHIYLVDFETKLIL